MPIEVRPYDPDRDAAAVWRIWEEVGWIDSSDGHARGLEAFLGVGSSVVAVLDGEAESMVHTTRGTVRYVEDDLRLSAISAVLTSRVGRKQGMATRLMAEALAASHEAGAHVAALGFFEQGFYDRFGFGTGPPLVEAAFDPASLRVEHVPYRTPVRLSPDDWRDIHGAMSRRLHRHGAMTLDPPEILQASLVWDERPFGLGYRDGERLTHFVFGNATGEHGPYKIGWMGYENTDQLLELLRLLRELGDQVSTVELLAPPAIQLQDLIDQPVRQWRRSKGSSHESHFRSFAWWQLRILDLAACLGARRWYGDPVRFDLRLRDPLADVVGARWPGLSGDYTVSVGPETTVQPGHRAGGEPLVASVNALSRLWFGVLPASSLAVTDDLAGPSELLSALDEAFRLPIPQWDWDF